MKQDFGRPDYRGAFATPADFANAAAVSGVVCLARVARLYRLPFDATRLDELGGTGEQTPETIAELARMIGLDASVRATASGSRGEWLQAACIVQLKDGRFSVVERIVGRRAKLFTAGGAHQWVDTARLLEQDILAIIEFSGVLPKGGSEGKGSFRIQDLWTELRGSHGALAQVVLLSLLLQFASLALPYYLQMAIDGAYYDHNISFLSAVAVGFALLVAFQGLTTFIRGMVFLRISAALVIGLYQNVARKLFRLPLPWFERRHLGEILQQFRSVAPIQQTLTENGPAAIVDGVLALLTLAIMLLYSVQLAAVTLTALLLYSIFQIAIYPIQRQAQSLLIDESAREHSVIIESIRGIRPLRLSGRERERFDDWRQRLVRSVNAQTSYHRFDKIRAALHTTIFGLENVMIVWMAVYNAIEGAMTLGMVFAYLAYKALFLTAGASLADKATAFRLLGVHLEQIREIAHAPYDQSCKPATRPPARLNGNIELRDACFRYSEELPLVLDHVNLTIDAGDWVAITGPSGAGKSTLVQVLLGLIEPTSGQVLVDGVPLETFGYAAYHAQIGAVLQEDTLFAGTIADNVALFDRCPDWQRIEEAIEAAALSSDISGMPLGLRSLVGDMGSALSGGQRQRLLLARALYRQPRVLVMDEATSHLDLEREQQVNDSIRALGITRIIVAHRRETIAFAHRIVRVLEGKAAQIARPELDPDRPVADASG